ncbi:kinase-like domain-containing protein [Scheffersomyces amazonensis]|uniref:kinase-like domain-containing protein n=1 Tax=Scheffersomyces amazonensis TaxID=1078765 RepID=UPI00315D2DC1
MNYCGIDYFVSNKQQLSELANQESKRTFSLLDESCKIYPIHDRHQTIINEPQVELIDRIRSTILQLKSQSLSHQYQILSTHKTLYSRFGVIKDILGKGSYGIIKIIDPNPNNVSLSNNVQHKLYAVKQFQHKKSPKESFDQYVNKILSEFIISCSLNCKHLVKSVDLMLTVPELSHRRQQSSDSLTSLPLSPSASPSRSSSLSRSLSPDSALLRGPSPMTTNDGINLITEQYYFSQVMECNRGGDLFAYLANTEEYPHSTMSLSEIDCFIKQIAKGLHYMHSHGAAHCDLKLENILINYKRTKSSDGPNKAKLILKISDFGRSYVFKTKWEKSEELVSKSKGPIGSLPYISPEEYDMSKSKEMALSKKDCWAFGILCLILFNIRKSYYDGDGFFPHINDDESNYKSNIDNNPRNSDDDTSDSNDDDSTDLIGNSPRTVFLWETTELKHHHRYSRKGQIYKDKNFEDYVNHRMIASYSDQTKEWIIQSEGTHKAIENLFTPSQSLHNDIDDNDLNQIRKMIIYKLLDIDPDTRMNMSHFLKSDWMDSVDNCIEYSE